MTETTMKGLAILLQEKEVAAMLDVCEKTLRRYSHDGVIPPYVKIGRKVYWRGPEFASWVEAGCLPVAQDGGDN